MNSIQTIIGQHKHSVARLFKHYGIKKPVTPKTLASAIVVYRTPEGNPFLDELHNEIAAQPVPIMGSTDQYDSYDEYGEDYDGYEDYDSYDDYDDYDDFGRGKGREKRQARKAARKDKRAARKAKKKGVYGAALGGYTPPDSGTGATASESNGDWSQTAEKGIGVAGGALDLIGKGKGIFSKGGGSGGGSSDDGGTDEDGESQDNDGGTPGKAKPKKDKDKQKKDLMTYGLIGGGALLLVLLMVFAFRGGKK